MGKDIQRILNRYQKQRPKARRNLDQFYATLETTAKRATFLQQKKVLSGRKLFFLGDDDLTSIAVSLISKPAEVTVADVDLRLLNYIKLIARREKMRIRTIKYDAKEKLPKILYRRFDFCFTDPPYTPSGCKLFLSRAIQSLNKDGQIYLCYGYSPKSNERVLPIQSLINQAGLVIEEKIPQFNHYRGAASIGNQSSLYHLTQTPQTNPLITHQFKGSIYSGRKQN